MVGDKKYNSLKLKLSRLFAYKKAIKAARVAETCSLDKAQTVGVTFAVRKPADLEQIRKVLKALAALKIKTFALGYIPEKKPGDFYLSEKSFNFFSDKDLDFLLQPKAEDALAFQDSVFDILIDLGTEQYYPMELLLNKSKAKFKVGWYCDNSPFDLMINTPKEQGLEYYFSQVLHYLKNLK